MKNTGYKHLTKQERNSIEFLLNVDTKLSEIAIQLNRDPRSISKEVKRNRYLFNKKNSKNICGIQDSCVKTRLCNNCLSGKCKYCSYAKCSDICNDFVTEPHCNRTKKYPFVCNGCDKLNNCSLPKYFYKADNAHKDYMYNVSNHKKGFKLSELQLAELDTIVSNGVSKGHSLDVIINSNNLDISLSTLYRVIDNNLLSVKNIELKRKVAYKQRYTNKPKAKPLNYDYLKGRTFKDYCSFIIEHPHLNVWQMDTIHGEKGFGQHYVLSLLHTRSNLQLFFKLDSITTNEVNRIFNSLKTFLGTDLFKDVFSIILTDNGPEFRDPLSMETCFNTGETLINVFFCEPRRSDQKAQCEKNHVHFRECYPKGLSLNNLTVKTLNYISNNINNYPRKSLNYNSPFQIAQMLLNKKVLELNNLSLVPTRDVTLKHIK